MPAPCAASTFPTRRGPPPPTTAPTTSAMAPYVVTRPRGTASTQRSTSSTYSSWSRVTCPGPAGGRSVRGLRRVDLVDPRDHTATDVDGVGVPGALHDRERLGRAHPRLAVHHDLLVGRELLERRAVE